VIGRTVGSMYPSIGGRYQVVVMPRLAAWRFRFAVAEVADLGASPGA
jgi:hypothetical protein